MPIWLTGTIIPNSWQRTLMSLSTYGNWWETLRRLLPVVCSYGDSTFLPTLAVGVVCANVDHYPSNLMNHTYLLPLIRELKLKLSSSDHIQSILICLFRVIGRQDRFILGLVVVWQNENCLTTVQLLKMKRIRSFVPTIHVLFLHPNISRQGSLR